ncbi:TetR/AcrR family transcriptional regulator [Spirosoma validum]|uniref:TetR/AcrR family transcriptional regulator n=1 Tax=Spirosoma validum TaxID=2771355 RepID=A0A927AX99_9BACT|nr:TetR/AcrR family transcriptional regulator [Spirosoma validum]MBD2751397.1 TetR/AcrR family transcriptional regulator [Spirosoma validum]
MRRQKHPDKQIEQNQRIIKALEEVISERGVVGVNVNLIASKSGIGKGIIYRNFGGEAELLMYYVCTSPAFPHLTMDPLNPPRSLQQERISQSMFGQMFQSFRELRSSKASRQIIKAMLIGDEPAIDFISQNNEQKLAEAVQQLSLPKGTDGQAAMAILLGGMYYMTIMAHNNHPFLGIDLRSDSGWLRIEQALKNFYKQLNKSANQTRTSKKSLSTVIPELVES